MSLSGSVFHKFVAFGTNEWWKAFCTSKGLMEKKLSICSLAKLGLSEIMSGGK